MARRGKPHWTFDITRYQVWVFAVQFRQGATMKAAYKVAKIRLNE